MNKILLIGCFLFLLIIGSTAREFPIPLIDDEALNYVCYKAIEPLIIDGKLDEASWQATEWTEDFVDIEGNLKPKPDFITKAKMLWDDDYFYFGAYLEENDLWASLTKRDAVIFFDNDFEIFIDPDGDTHDYYEFEMNALNTIWDLLVIKPYRDRQQVAFNSFDFKGLKSAVYLKGTLNDPSDKDEYWSLEVAIPWESLAEAAHKPTPPHEADIWKVNFSRVHWQLDKQADGYTKKVNPETGNNYPEMNIVWSPQGLIAMHYPEMWGDVMFTHNVAGSKEVTFVPDELRTEKRFLRNIYYAQKERFLSGNKYAKRLSQLKIKPAKFADYKAKPEFYISPHTFQVILKSKSDKPDLHIFHDGRLLEKIDF